MNAATIRGDNNAYHGRRRQTKGETEMRTRASLAWAPYEALGPARTRRARAMSCGYYLSTG
jgi:hypothetical protein